MEPAKADRADGDPARHLPKGTINTWVVRALHPVRAHRHFITVFAIVMGLTTLLATMLHGVEAGIWAVAYRWLGAMPDAASAMVYSLSAMTAYGHAELYLATHWQLMGAIEALNGLLLFGPTTAFLYGHVSAGLADAGQPLDRNTLIPWWPRVAAVERLGRVDRGCSRGPAAGRLSGRSAAQPSAASSTRPRPWESPRQAMRPAPARMAMARCCRPRQRRRPVRCCCRHQGVPTARVS